MVLSILVPFLPIIFTLCALNVLALENLEPFNFGTIHGDEGAMIHWASVTLLPSRVIDFGSLNNAYISIITAIPIFIFFGMTKDAMNSYRMVLLFCDFGKLWPSLYNEYDPDKSALRKAENSSKTSESSTA
jgi:pheromone a factor receptor